MITLACHLSVVDAVLHPCCDGRSYAKELMMLMAECYPGQLEGLSSALNNSVALTESRAHALLCSYNY
jgi:NRPS condensation-like uncharacterized protein